MISLLPGLILAFVSAGLLVYAFRAHERHWALGFMGWRKVYAGLVSSLLGAVLWLTPQWLPEGSPAIPSLPVAAGGLLALGLGLIVAGSMERLRDLAEERRRLEEIRAGFDLYDTLREVVSGPYTFLEILEFALKEMVRASGVSTGGLWLYNPTAREWILTGAANMSQNFRRQVETIRGAGTGFDRLARLHKVHIFSRVEEIRLFFPEWEGEGIRSILGLPLVTGGAGSSERRLLGVIILADSAEGRFDDDRARRLHAAADYVAAVIAEGRLHRQLEASHQQAEGLKATHERETAALRDQMRIAEERSVEERHAWERELAARQDEFTARLEETKRESAGLLEEAKIGAAAQLEEFKNQATASLEETKNEAAAQIDGLERRLHDSLAQWTSERELMTKRQENELTRLREQAHSQVAAAQHQADLAMARLEELRRTADEERERLTQDIQRERTRQEQLQSELHAHESSLVQAHRELDEERRARTIDAQAGDRKIDALLSQHEREKSVLAEQHAGATRILEDKITELSRALATVKEAHESKLSEWRSQLEDERRAAGDEQRTLKQEIQALRLSLADQQAQWAAERDIAHEEARRVEARYTQLLEAQRDTHNQERETWDATHEASEQYLLDLKLELENTRFEQGMALARAHNETVLLREQYENELTALRAQSEPADLTTSLSDDSALSEPGSEPPGEESSIDTGARNEEEVLVSSRPLHDALLDWVSQQDNDEWHLELMAHHTPEVDRAWLADSLTEVQATCRNSQGDNPVSFSVQTHSSAEGTLLRIGCLSVLSDSSAPLTWDGWEHSSAGYATRWILSSNERVGFEILFGKVLPDNTSEPEAEPPDSVDSTHSEEPVEHHTPLEILIVEDQLEMRDLLVGMVEGLNHHVSSTTSAQDGYARFVSEPFDLVVVSADLPQQEGFALTGWIKSHRAETPVVLVIDGSVDDSVAPLDDFQADAILTKPFDLSQLQECVTRLAALPA